MRQRARVHDSDVFDDPFGSSFILPVDEALTAQQLDLCGAEAFNITTSVVPLPYPELNILLPDYQVDDIVFGYDSLDIYSLPSAENAAEPDYSTTKAIVSLFGTD
jgi:hypothetical protein